MTTAKQVNQALRGTKSVKHDDKRPAVEKKAANEKVRELIDHLKRTREQRDGKD